jgi:hypothetical protein
MDPHAPGLPQVSDKSAPALVESLLTYTITLAVAPVSMEAGGALLNAIEIGGCGVI